MCMALLTLVSYHTRLQTLAAVGDVESEAYIHAKEVRSALDIDMSLKFYLA